MEFQSISEALVSTTLALTGGQQQHLQQEQQQQVTGDEADAGLTHCAVSQVRTVTRYKNVKYAISNIVARKVLLNHANSW